MSNSDVLSSRLFKINENQLVLADPLRSVAMCAASWTPSTSMNSYYMD
jgi:hypothetical protein